MVNVSEDYNSLKLLSENNVKKYVLPHFNLDKAKVSQIKFKNTVKQRAVYKVESENKAYCLKKVYYSTGSLLFVYSAVEWWYKNGINVPRILSTIKGSRFVNYSNMLFILTPWIEGKKCDYDIEKNFIDTGVNLGKMHYVSKNFSSILGSTNKENSDILYNSIHKHFLELLNYSNLAFKYKDEFSKLYLQYFEPNYTLAEFSCSAASSINNKYLSKSLCHLDYVNKNLIFDENNDIWVIDFDNCRKDFCAHDISYSLRRYLRRDKTNWNLELCKKWLHQYDNINPLTINDYKYILAYLSFPQRYWKISRDYYRNYKKCNTKAFCTLLKKAVKNLENQIIFVENLKDYIEDKFSTKL